MGNKALDPHWAFYSDTSFQPDPPPAQMMERLKATGANAVLLVDNCSVEEHNALTKLRRGDDETIRLLTIEYDIADNLPENTGVYRLEPSSPEMLTRLVARWRPDLGSTAIQRVIEASGGNARVARAILNQFSENDSLSGLSDRELFDRLFWQKNAPDPELRQVAGLLSLVYSFSIENTENNGAEVDILADMAGMPVRQFHRHVANLQNRHLVQQRGPWRALLPHALAERLCKEELSAWRLDDLLNTIETGMTPRMRMSLAHRIGVLHDHPFAQKIATKWLAENGSLANPDRLEGEQFRMLQFAAPIVPQHTLHAIERAVAGWKAEATDWARSWRAQALSDILRFAARHEDLTMRAARSLWPLALQDRARNQVNSPRANLRSLYAFDALIPIETLNDRLSLLQTKLGSEDASERELALEYLDQAFSLDRFPNQLNDMFGSRVPANEAPSRSRGTSDRWFSEVLAILRSSVSEDRLKSASEKILCTHFAGHWRFGLGQAVMGHLFRQIADDHGEFWREGWIAISDCLDRYGDRMSDAYRTTLAELERDLRSGGPIAELSVFLDQPPGRAMRLLGNDDDDSAVDLWSAGMEHLKTLAAQLSTDHASLQLAMKMIAEGSRSEAGYAIGKALAGITDSPQDLWRQMIETWRQVEPGTGSTSALRGFLFGLQNRDPELIEDILESALADPALLDVFPDLQCHLRIGSQALRRLHRCLDKTIVQPGSFGWLRRQSSTGDMELIELDRLLRPWRRIRNSARHSSGSDFRRGSSRPFHAKLRCGTGEMFRLAIDGFLQRLDRLRDVCGHPPLFE